MKKHITGYPSIDKPWLNYYTDKMINTFMGVLYPTLCDVFETLWASLPRTYDVGSVVGTIDLFDYLDKANR